MQLTMANNREWLAGHRKYTANKANNWNNFNKAQWTECVRGRKVNARGHHKSINAKVLCK